MAEEIFTKKLSIIGSTGSVGTAALKQAKKLGIKVCAITGHSNLELLKRQADELCPDIVGVTDPDKFAEAKRLFGGRLVTGIDALTAPTEGCDTALISVTGISGLTALEAAIKNNRRAALANKESLVAGGSIINDLLKRQNAGLRRADGRADGCDCTYKTAADGKKAEGCDCTYNTMADIKKTDGKKAEIIPVDSEHSAIFQCLKAGRDRDVSRLILTASGGAFYNYDEQSLKKITPADIFHPNWKMGRKITLDSCTLMNKALEIIEAYWLFLADKIDCADKTGCADKINNADKTRDCGKNYGGDETRINPADKIDYVIHPESLIHSMVEFCDGSAVAQIANPDMSLPISYALTYPKRTEALPPFSFDRPLTFLKKNPLFFAPQLGLEAVNKGGSAGAVLNAANEAATELFEKGLICFTDITKIVQKCLFSSTITAVCAVSDVVGIHLDTVQKIKKDYKSYIN